jgi:hypothetical protein
VNGAALGPPAGSVRRWLRLEGLAVLAASALAYRHLDASWVRFAVLFLAPDLSMLGYLAGPRAGAALYNAAHSYVGPLVALTAALGASRPELVALGLIWTAHIGFDRMLGYGLKLPTGFQDTHLGRIGRE